MQRRMSDGTVRKHVRNAKALFAAAAKRGLIASSPFDGLTSASVAAHFPRHAVSKWVGHSVAVSVKHYLTVTDDLSNAAAGLDGEDLQATEQATARMETGGNERETVRNKGARWGVWWVRTCRNPYKTRCFRR